MATHSCTCASTGNHEDGCPALRAQYIARVRAVAGYAMIASKGDATEAYLALLGALLRVAGTGRGTELLDAAAGAIAIASRKIAERMPPAPATKPGSVPS